ncbi:hypothetical protein OIU78_024177 [Salix suchowensis]|nr:hypothetical protein OIU78_024177 [Salix suchowensis]
MVRLLSRTGVNVNAVNSEGLTALDLAVRSTTGSNDEDEIQEIIRKSIFASLSFQVGMNPPGGVWQEWGSSNATKSASDGNTDTDPNSWSESLFLGLFELASVSEALTEVFLWDWQSTSLVLLPMMSILLLIAAAEFAFGVAIVTDTSVASISAATKGGKEKERIDSEKAMLMKSCMHDEIRLKVFQT